ncbi:MAG: peptidylprolyl isomerase [bacterium]|nr:peptidylprolyl isomerase [bacterium]
MSLYVNGEKVDDQRIDEEMERLRPQYRKFAEAGKVPDEKDGQLREWSRENVIERVLMNQVAQRDPEPLTAERIDETFAQILEQHGGREKFAEKFGLTAENEGDFKKDVERRLRFERLVERITAAAGDPPDDEVKKYYEENIDRFTVPEMVRAAHIVKHPRPGWDEQKVQEELQGILAEIRGKDNFEEMAAKHSECADNAGDLGYFPRGEMVQSFEDVVFVMQPGEVSDVFRTEFGWHIVKVKDRRPTRPYALDEVRKSIVKELMERRRQKAIEDFLDAEREKATIEDK